MDLLGVLINRNVESSRLLSRLRVHPPVLLTALRPLLCSGVSAPGMQRLRRMW